MKKRAITFIETIIVINLGLALISSIAVEMLWGQYFGFAVLAGALAWGLPNWYFSRSFKANNFLGKIETLKINFFFKLIEKTNKLLRLKKAKNPLFLAYVRIHKGESNK